MMKNTSARGGVYRWLADPERAFRPGAEPPRDWSPALRPDARTLAIASIWSIPSRAWFRTARGYETIDPCGVRLGSDFEIRREHDRSRVIARGDDVLRRDFLGGLGFEIRIRDDDAGRALVDEIDSGKLASSIAFRNADDDTERDSAGIEWRTIRACELEEVSVVQRPAHPTTATFILWRRPNARVRGGFSWFTS